MYHIRYDYLQSRFQWHQNNFDESNIHNTFLSPTGPEYNPMNFMANIIWNVSNFQDIWYLNKTETRKHRCCLESVVSRKAILQHPLSVYMKLEAEINRIYTNVSWAWGNERVWEFIFSKNSNQYGRMVKENKKRLK